MAAVYPGPQNVFVRAHEHSNKMVIDFARNIKKFAVNKYTQVVPTEKVAGYYLEMTIEEAGRIIASDLRNFMWFDGAPAPEGVDGRESFEYKPFSTIRYAYPFFLGDLTIDQASWNILDQHSSIHSRQAMTARTQLAITQLTTTSLYAASHQLDFNIRVKINGEWVAREATHTGGNDWEELSHEIDLSEGCDYGPAEVTIRLRAGAQTPAQVARAVLELSRV